MSTYAIVTGSLFRAPEERRSKTGKTFARATLKTQAGDSFQFVRFIAFSTLAIAELMRLAEGDVLAIQGPLKTELYSKDGGEPKISLSIVADQVLALRQPPKPRAKKAPAGIPPRDTRWRQERCAGSCAPGDPSDEIPFGGEP